MIPDRTLSVGELADALNAILALAAPYGLWVAGEVADISRHASGHVYFDLVEPNDTPGAVPKAKVSVALFRGAKIEVNAAMKAYGNAVRMTDGVQVRIRGHLDYYAPTGQLKLVMRAIDPAYTLGRIAADREVVLRKLAAEGILRRNAGVPVPAVPLRVGLVASADSAAAADVTRVLSDSGFAFTVLAAAAQVQGAGAPASVAAALNRAAARADVVILARGGGSKTDLVAFDHESVARAVALCERPVFTGIGHDTDRSAADEAAHTACATPTGAAAAVVEIVERWLGDLRDVAVSIAMRSVRALEEAGRGLDIAGATAARGAERFLGRADRALAAASGRLVSTGRAAGRHWCRRLDGEAARLAAASRLGVRSAERRVASVSERIRLLDPAYALRRGWSITRSADGKIVCSTDQVADGDRLTIQVADGTFASTVEDQVPKPAVVT